jgi:hypothetical protein
MDAKNGISWTLCLVGGASALQQFKVTWFSVEILSLLFFYFSLGNHYT